MKQARRAIPSTMTAAVYRGQNDVRMETVPVPEIGPGELLVRVEACAICGTDIKSFRNGNPRIQPPQTMGHEFVGTVAAAGEGALGPRPGARVVMATTIGCGECRYCRAGRSNLCRKAEAMGFHYPGAMAPWVESSRSQPAWPSGRRM
jgi:L-iditol 2-dehydrogenase